MNDRFLNCSRKEEHVLTMLAISRHLLLLTACAQITVAVRRKKDGFLQPSHWQLPCWQKQTDMKTILNRHRPIGHTEWIVTDELTFFISLYKQYKKLIYIPFSIL